MNYAASMLKEQVAENASRFPAGFIHDYDAHIYFEPEQREFAAALRERAIREFAEKPVFVGRMIDRPIGPHPIPMFEMDFGKLQFKAMLRWLAQNRGPLTVLIHTVTGDDWHDHFDGALWLGNPLKLDTSKLDPSPVRR